MIGGEHDIGMTDAFEAFKKQFGKQYDSVEGELNVIYLYFLLLLLMVR